MSQSITGKFMETNLKYGKTLSYFTNYFGLTQEEFLIKLEKTFSKKAYKGYLARLKKNEKVHRKDETHNTNFEEVEDSNFETCSIEEDTEHTTEICPKESSKLDELKLEKEKFQSILNHLEIEHKELCSERVQIKHSILWYRDKLDELKDEVCQCKNELSHLLNELNTKLDIMHELNSSISETREKLSEIDKNIVDLKKISIFVYNSGELELETESKIEIPEWNEELFKSILFDEQSESYTVKKLKTLAKVISLVSKLKKDNLHYEVIFEDASLENFFSKKVNEVIISQ